MFVNFFLNQTNSARNYEKLQESTKNCLFWKILCHNDGAILTKSYTLDVLFKNSTVVAARYF